MEEGGKEGRFFYANNIRDREPIILYPENMVKDPTHTFKSLRTLVPHTKHPAQHRTGGTMFAGRLLCAGVGSMLHVH